MKVNCSVCNKEIDTEYSHTPHEEYCEHWFGNSCDCDQGLEDVCPGCCEVCIG